MKRCLGILLALFAVQAHGADTWLKVADEYGSFPLVVKAVVRYCGAATQCVDKEFEPAKKVECNNGSFKSVALPDGDPAKNVAKACYVIETISYRPICLPALRADVWNIRFQTGIVPVASSTRYGKYVVWIEAPSSTTNPACNGEVDARLYGDAQRDDLETKRPAGDDAVNAWAKAQPLVADTAAEAAFLTQVKAAYAAKLSYVVPGPVPAPKYVVQRESKDVVGSRPVYRLKPDGTRNTTAVKDVKAAAEVTECTDQLGTTNYYLVPSLSKDYPVYAICRLK